VPLPGCPKEGFQGLACWSVRTSLLAGCSLPPPLLHHSNSIGGDCAVDLVRMTGLAVKRIRKVTKSADVAFQRASDKPLDNPVKLIVAESSGKGPRRSARALPLPRIIPARISGPHANW
jgi:hypothetical protein